MNKKALIEKRNSLVDEQTKILDLVEVEVRGFKEEEENKFHSLTKEINDLDKVIEEVEKRAVQETEIKIEEKEERNEMNIQDKVQIEKRGLKDYLQKRSSDATKTMVTDENGGMIPEFLHSEIIEKLTEVAPLFAAIPKLTPTSGTHKLLKESEKVKAGFVGENESLEIGKFSTETVEITQVRAGAAISLSQHLINDSGIDIVSYANSQLLQELGAAFDRSMVVGSGDGEFQGLRQAPVRCDIDVQTPNTLTVDDLMNVYADMNPHYLAGTKWVMNRENFKKISLMKDGNNDFYVTRPNNYDLVDGKVVYRLFGSEILIHEDAADIYLVNLEKAYKGMLKKDVSLKRIDSDNANALRGTVTLMIDAYADAKIVNEDAIRVLKGI